MDTTQANSAGTSLRRGIRGAVVATFVAMLPCLAVPLVVCEADGAAAVARTAVGGTASEDLLATARRDGRIRVIVELDVAGAAQGGAPAAEARAQRRAAIAAARSRLDARLPSSGWRTTRTYERLPFVALEVSPEALGTLRSSPEVRGIVADRLEAPQLAESGPIVEADQAWEEGYDGTGWAIAVLDTGVDGSHEFLAGKVVAEACFSGNASCPNGQSTQYGTGAGLPCSYAPGACRHGTHVAGVAAGRGELFSGVARGAGVVAVQVFSRFSGADCDGQAEDPCALSYSSDTIAALEWIDSLRSTQPIAAINLSLGGGRFYSEESCDLEDPARKAIVDELRAAGVATVVAAGNGYHDDSLSSPGCLSSVVSVGATNDFDDVAVFSNSASFLDLLAPGVRVFSSVPGDEYVNGSGTSQATPQVAGAFAILSQKLGRAAVEDALEALAATGLPVYDPRNTITKPRIRIRAALGALPSGAPSGVQITPDGKRTLISKDVNGARWAITSHDGGATVTGNVYNPGDPSGEPEFVFCERTASDGNPDPYAEQLTYDCSSARDCTSLSCPTDQWTFVKSVELPGSFFLPRTSAAGGATSPTAAPAQAATSDAPSALQITPDELHTLVSKDVDGARWAITLNADDRTATGNVYLPGDQEPLFVWCSYQGDDGNPDPYWANVTYACSTASRCTTSSCTPDQWTFLRNVTLPGWFFLPRV